MKILKITVYVIFFALAACNDDFLERYPLSSLSPETYFTSEAELKAYTNSFYSLCLPEMVDRLPGIKQGDDVAATTIPAEVMGTRTVPASGNEWTWTALRSINFFLAHSHKCENADIRAKYDGIARFWRAFFYFDKLVRFGDVPWYDRVIEQNDEEALNRARDSRGYVFERMLEDIDYAIAYCPVERNPEAVTKWTALALKSRMCLFEGTFRKYHGRTGWEDILAECERASDEMIRNSGYAVYTSSPDKAYREMFLTEKPNSEFVLAETWTNALSKNHYVNLYLQGRAQSHVSMTRALFNSYLNSDGTKFTGMAGYAVKSFYESTQGRDPRLGQSIRTQGYTYPGSSEVLLTDFSASTTGYMLTKFVTNITTVNGTNALPHFRYAEVLLNFAEARAELGAITQADINRSIKPLRDRVGMPNLDLSAANAGPDPFLADQYPRVTGDNKGIILEIRRERRVELFLEAMRWNDILRWKEGQLLARQAKGAYFAGPGEYDIDGDGKPDLVIYSGTRPPSTIAGCQYMDIGDMNLSNGTAGGEIIVNPHIARTWNEERDYYYPIPLQELQLNPNLVQNPLWATE
jgi:hypothetical protein